ncbi:DNA-binding protein WhiA [Geosporobacter ferrireducens]|uniref:Probable cell division protein WhiA n=1 Tax=Geosporobacter ferrireducens TaxID=1424294 RepID=A0A1D8GLJ6_9FIRM|nr:DNA-binding protein WhiA [Geosporobacter ferrireducens]AOT71778.1 DNA-binding protein WhiA [Geosporobacter ferrireducens]MTI55566.1 DNA-binding protein WhiA [Geosporobacter ferrireducens]
MSFSMKTKNELARIIPEDSCCQLAQLAAMIRMSGTIQLAGFQKVNIKIATENAAVARTIFTLLKKSFGIHTELMVKRNKLLKKNNHYMMTINSDAGANDILKTVKILKLSDEQFTIEHGVPWELIKSRCCKRAYLRGAFLGAGSVSDPEKAYHLEFVTTSEEHSEDLKNLINEFDLGAKIIQRKQSYVVYLKEGDQIVDLLNIMGAYSALLNLENIRIYKQVRNNVNRIVNCETANLSKIVNASIRQIENIEYIQKTEGFRILPEGLREIAELRLHYQDASLKELGNMLTPPVGKSGVNHRLRKIDKIAEKLKQKKGDM